MFNSSNPGVETDSPKVRAHRFPKLSTSTIRSSI
jgi:hypothetical protein